MLKGMEFRIYPNRIQETIIQKTFGCSRVVYNSGIALRNHKLAKSISDVSWSKFFDMLEYKSASYGTEIIKVPRFYSSSQTCGCCGYKNPNIKNLSIREWTCPVCGTYHDRDGNAAKNILKIGLSLRMTA